MLGAAIAALTACSTFVSAASLPQDIHHQWSRRALVNASDIADKSYDYIVVGGGNAGLVVASRLSENSSASVLVIEAGTEPSSDIQERINTPAQAYLNGVTGTDWDWAYTTTEQSGMDGRTIGWPRGKVLGGSSAINGLYMTRASKIEYDTWDSLQNDSLYSWDWDTVYPYLKKMENYNEPSQDVIDTTGVVYNMSLHGTDGPLHYSQGGYALNQEGIWMQTWSNLGYEAQDPYGGETWGPRICASNINPSNWTRSYSRSAYLDPVMYRTNLDVLTGQQVTKINFDSGDDDLVRATSVNFAASQGASTQTVSASQDIIISAGVIGSPQLLQVSGIGASSMLQDLGIDVVVDLPGVGEHLTDHVSMGVTYKFNDSIVPISGDLLRSNDTFQAQQLSLWQNGEGAQSLYSLPNQPTTYVSMADLYGADNATDLLNDLKQNASNAVAAQTWTDDTVRAGYAAVLQASADKILSSQLGAIEFLQANLGYGSGEQGITFTFQLAVQHAASQGYVHINSSDIFDYPLINPNYLYNQFDSDRMVAALNYLDTVMGASPMDGAVVSRIDPQAPDSDADAAELVRQRSGTEYHPAMSCSMLPRELGGVVDTSLTVHGTSNLRVVDSSIIPIGLSAHLQEPTYGIGEYGAAIISGQAEKASSDAESSSSGSGAVSASGSAAQTGDEQNAAASTQGSDDDSDDSSAPLSFTSSFTTLFALMLLVVKMA